MDDLPIDVGGDGSPTPAPVVVLGPRRGPGLLIVVALVVVVVLAVVTSSFRSSSDSASPTTVAITTTAPTTTVHAVTSSLAPTAVVTTTVSQRTTTTPPQAPVVIELNRPFLPSVTKTELLVQGVIGLDRIDLDKGRVISTPLPDIGIGQRAIMIAGSRSALVRPLSTRTGYLVPDDGGPPQPLIGRLAESTLLAYPGPALGLVWLSSVGRIPQGLDLIGFDVEYAQTSVTTSDLRPWGPDGTGQVVLVGVGGSYVTGPRGLTRVTTGVVLAAGPTSWLVRECDDHHVCAVTTIDRRTGNRTRLNNDSLADGSNLPTTGVVSPDGATAALAFNDTTGELDLLDMRSGDQVVIAQSAAQVAPVWSVDGRYLFFVNDNTRVASAFDRSAGTSTELLTQLAQIESLAIRPMQ